MALEAEKVLEIDLLRSSSSFRPERAADVWNAGTVARGRIVARAPERRVGARMERRKDILNVN